jgi:hypothetical protein
LKVLQNTKSSSSPLESDVRLPYSIVHRSPTVTLSLISSIQSVTNTFCGRPDQLLTHLLQQ